MLGLRCCVGFSTVAASSDYSLAMIHGFSLQELLLLQSMASRALWASVVVHLGSVVAVPGL